MKVMASVGALLALCCSAHRAWAGDPLSLRDLLGLGPRVAQDSLPALAHYTSDSGMGFVLDRNSERQALLRFDGSSEVWALTVMPGPRGDKIYKNDLGEPVLRATRIGGLTVFTNAIPGGVAAEPVGLATTPHPTVVSGPVGLWSAQVQASARASRAAAHLVFFDAIDANVTPASESLFADTFLLTADAIVQVSEEGRGGMAALSRLFKVRFIQGKAADAVMVGPMVQITVAPAMGVAGRPSSRRIAAAIAKR